MLQSGRSPSGSHRNPDQNCGKFKNSLSQLERPRPGASRIHQRHGRHLCRAHRRLKASDPIAAAIAGAIHPKTVTMPLSGIGQTAAQESRYDTPGKRLRRLFVLLMGLGMRESSGQYCEGRDRSAHNTSADTAEAGLFQVSFDLIGIIAISTPSSTATSITLTATSTSPRRV